MYPEDLRVMLKLLKRSIDNDAEELLYEWIEWWLTSSDAPSKMPESLHVRTVLFFHSKGWTHDSNAEPPQASRDARGS